MLILIALFAQSAAVEPSQCQALTARSAELKGEMRRTVGDQAPGRAEAQANRQAVTAGTAVAGQVVAQLGGGVIGHVISEGALKAQNAQASSAMRSTEDMMARAVELSRQIHQVEKERKAACGELEAK